MNIKQELRSCQHFFVDSPREWARHKVFKYAIENLNTTIVDEKLDHLFNNLKCAESEYCFWVHSEEYRWRIQLFLRTRKQNPNGSIQTCFHQGRLGKLKIILNKSDVLELCSRKQMNTKWKFYKLTSSPVFAALFEDVPMGCKDAVLPEPLLKNQTINCLTSEVNTRQPYGENVRLFRTLALHLHGNQ